MNEADDMNMDEIVDDFDDFDGFEGLDEKPRKRIGFLQKRKMRAAERAAAEAAAAAAEAEEIEQEPDDEEIEDEDTYEYYPQIDELTAQRIRRRHERQRRRRRNERIVSVISIFLIILCVAAFLFYFLYVRTGKVTVPGSGSGDVNVYQLSQTEAPVADAGGEGTTDVGTDESGSQTTGMSADGTSWANLPPAADGNNLLDLIMAGGGNHAVFLTFDDGPTENITPQILDILAEYGVKATFFETGANIEANHEMAERVAAEGHCIAGHSYSHDYDKLYATEESFVDEVQRTYDLIAGLYPADKQPMKLMRFPGGSYNAGDHAAEKQVYKETLKQMGFYYADWNCLNGDAEGKEKNAAELYQYFVSSITTNNLVVLMHDAATKQETVNALPQIIEYCKQNGYEFRTLDDIVYDPAPAVESDETATATEE